MMAPEEDVRVPVPELLEIVLDRGASDLHLTDPSNFTNINYTNIHCIPISSPCDPTQTSSTAYQVFNALSKSNMQGGVYADWQTDPHCGEIAKAASAQCTNLDLTNLSVGGDLTIVTNAPIYFGNTNPITSSGPATVVVVSLYIPGTSSTCTVNGGDCSIYGKNAVVFDAGAVSDPNDAIAAILYTPGKMAFEQQTNAADGALYAGAMDIANGFGITYNDRISSIVGFGGSLEQVLWQEIS